MTTHSLAPAYLIGQRYYIHPSAGEIGLVRNQQLYTVQKVEPKAMQVLQELMLAPDGIVSREHLVSEVWDNYGGAEEALFQTISKLRKALGDDARRPKVIETIPKKGYRLKLPVQPSRVFSQKQAAANYQQVVVVSAPGLFTGFIERLTQPRFLIAFLLFSFVLLGVLGLLYQIIFWIAVSI